jgi:hypothetical protein
MVSTADLMLLPASSLASVLADSLAAFIAAVWIVSQRPNSTTRLAIPKKMARFRKSVRTSSYINSSCTVSGGYGYR